MCKESGQEEEKKGKWLVRGECCLKLKWDTRRSNRMQGRGLGWELWGLGPGRQSGEGLWILALPLIS